MKRKKRHFQTYAALCASLLLTTGCAGALAGENAENTSFSPVNIDNADTETQENQEAAIDTVFPAFTAMDLDGNVVTENVFQEKDLTVLNIWGTFCGPCIGEMPELGEWAKEMPDNVQLLGLVIDISGEEDTEHIDLAVDITQNAGVDFTNLIANTDFAPILKDVIGVPTTLFVDGDGNIVGDPIVGADVDGYKAFVEEYLNEQ